MTPLEERLVLDLHSKWGNRWSRIARKLPGRTDNEIKNYWRTHMRKKAQEKKKSPTSRSSSSSSYSSSITTSPSMEIAPVTETMGRSFYDTGGKDKVAIAPSGPLEAQQVTTKVYSMDEIWKDIELLDDMSLTHHAMNSPIWDFEPNHDSLMMQHMGDQFHSFPYYNHMIG
ncbi:hypothetical protein ACS0TY_020510 [Phlomoides rotata]